MDEAQPTSLTKTDLAKAIGQTLQKRRLMRDISIAKAFDSIKIRPQTLVAIENGDWHELPGDVYIRGFVIRYAQFLGLNGQELINPYLELSHKPVEVSSSMQTMTAGAQKRLGYLWVAALVVLAGMAGLTRFMEGCSPQKNNHSLQNVPTPTPFVALSTPSVQMPLVNGKHRLEIFSPNELWLRVTTEKRSFEGLIPAKSTWTFESEGVHQIRFGHTHDIGLHFDGKSIPVSDKEKRLTLPYEN